MTGQSISLHAKNNNNSTLQSGTKQATYVYGLYQTTAPFIAETSADTSEPAEDIDTISIISQASLSAASTGSSTAYGIYNYNSSADTALTTTINNQNGNTLIASYADNDKINSKGIAIVNYNAATAKNTVSLTSKLSNKVYGADQGIYVSGKSGSAEENRPEITLISHEGDNIVVSDSQAVYLQDGAHGTFTAGTSNVFVSDNQAALTVNKASAEIKASGSNFISSNSKSSISAQASDLTILGADNYLSGTTTLSQNTSFNLQATESSNTFVSSANSLGMSITGSSGSVSAVTDNIISGYNYGVNATSSSEATISAGNDNIIMVNPLTVQDTAFGQSYAVSASNSSTLTLSAQKDNILFGAANSDSGGAVNISGRNNIINSYTVIYGAGDLNTSTDDKFKNVRVISALYAEGSGSSLNISGSGTNYLRTYAVSESSDLERVLWAYDGADINVEGHTVITTDHYALATNSKDIAVAAGSAVNLTKEKVEADVQEDQRAMVEITYADLQGTAGTTQSSITGDILAAYAGTVNINPAADDTSSGIHIEGNLLAGNNGVLNVNLGNGGILTGRSDDYGEAGIIDDSGHLSFFNPAFSSTIYRGGKVNLTMGKGAVWYVTGQSWITSISTPDVSDEELWGSAAALYTGATIDLHYNQDYSTSARSLTIYEMNGDARFNIHLDGNRSASDMIYMKKANGHYLINIVEPISDEEINAGGFDGLRFATVGAGSNVQFTAVTLDGGVLNKVYTVAEDAYDGNDENEAYNGTSLSEEKPGDTVVDGLFAADTEPVQMRRKAVALATGIALYADKAEEDAPSDDTNTEEPAANVTETTNFKLVTDSSVNPDHPGGDHGTDTPDKPDIDIPLVYDSGRTIIDMSRANYANAVYMDTFNKRQGEACYSGTEEAGVWVRMRYDNIGKESSFRTHNTMVEVGFDRSQAADAGIWHYGLALDYLNGSIDYHMVNGDGDLERYGAWLYATYLGKDGDYADFVAKYGHLSNDFEFRTVSRGELVTGDYSNDVFSLSAELGRKLQNNQGWYVEPQAQLQYSYVTSADYTTSQGSQVDLDAIHSLIGRAGLRAGHDFSSDEYPVSLYVRADVLHEFMGDQDITASDKTGVLHETYENDDTWYSTGVGITVQSSERSYIFCEAEQVFGADNDSTYTISGGFRYSF